jgi:hypothetical protein
MSALLTFEQAEQVLPEEAKLDVMLLMLNRYGQDWDEALAEDAKRTERALHRVWDEALSENHWRTKGRPWALAVQSQFEEHELLTAKMNADPMFRLLTYEAADLAKRLKKRKKAA